MTAGITEPPQPDTLPEPAPSLRRRAAFSPRVALSVVALLFFAILLYVASPFLLWAYDVQGAGTLMETAIRWPEPRGPDSLPSMNDAGAAEQALNRLTAAMQRRPNHPHAYRMAGQIYAAEGDLTRAAEMWDKAYTLSPKNRLMAWEASLIYEQMMDSVVQAPQEPLVPMLAESAEAQETTVAMPYAGFADGGVVTATTLFLRPPATLRYTLTVPSEQQALRFLMGIDPSQATQSDGATYQIWLEPDGEEPTVLYERTLDGVEAAQGWVPGWADLSAYSGQSITLRFETTPEPSGSDAGAWAGWGDVALTTVDAATYASLAPQARMVAAWRNAAMDAEMFRMRSELAHNANRPDEQAQWLTREQLLTDASR